MPLINKVVVCNTSPIIYLSSIGDIGVLADLFGTILISPAVHNELAAGKDKGAGYREALAASWINVIKITNQFARNYLLTDLDVGEAETIILADETGADLILMDDRLGRKVAELKGHTVIGTLKVLLLAKRYGLISTVRTRIDKLLNAGFWVTDPVCTMILKEAGEL